LGMSEDDLKENREVKKKIDKEKKKLEKEGGGETTSAGFGEAPVEEPETPTETAPE
jgi:hypothetical protein